MCTPQPLIDQGHHLLFVGIVIGDPMGKVTTVFIGEEGLQVSCKSATQESTGRIFSYN